MSRRPADGLPAGVAHRRGDLAEVDGLKELFEGAEAVYLLVAGLGDTLRPREIVAAAVACGVRRIVLQSSQLVGTRSDSVSHDFLRAFEAAVRESGRRARSRRGPSGTRSPSPEVKRRRGRAGGGRSAKVRGAWPAKVRRLAVSAGAGSRASCGRC
ncbi:NAD(P)H-binding protein, partial [Streptomyces sp. NPDC055721]